MRADKTLSELNHLMDSTYNERLSQTARMAVNTIKKLQAEIERLGVENSRLQTNVEIGVTSKLNDLEQKHIHLKSDKEMIELLTMELKSIIECIGDYYENPEEADIPVDDILDWIVRDASGLLQKLDL